MAILTTQCSRGWRARRGSSRPAALIMISVFGAFVLGDDVIIKMFGIGVAVAVLLDATIVRMIIVPAVMTLFDKAAWWLPRSATQPARPGRRGAEASSTPGPTADRQVPRRSLGGIVRRN